MHRAPRIAGILLAAGTLGLPGALWAAPAARINIVFLQWRPKVAVPSTMLDPPPSDTVLRGAELAAADNNTTGQFTGQTTVLSNAQVGSPDGAVSAFTQALRDGVRLFVADVPSDLLLKLADTPGAAQAVILDASDADDRLRGRDCRANTLHMLPSRAMLADALMEYLVAKDWRRIMLIAGRDPADALYADAIRHAAEKFQVSIEADRPWQFNPAAQQADTGHYQVNDEVQKATQGVTYDLLVVADEVGHFGDKLAYRTDIPRPVAGTHGLVPSAWARPMDEYASTQLQTRFRHLAGRPMTDLDYGGWLAVRAVGEAATRSGSTDPRRIIAYLEGPDFALSGYKGPELSFRSWDGQLRQPVLLADDRSIISIAPLPGFLHERNDLDSLGADEAESQCKK
jgi:ABC transporter substrate binding protein (PQQ-dependent alcohol dehydrogenase system)